MNLIKKVILALIILAELSILLLPIIKLMIAAINTYETFGFSIEVLIVVVVTQVLSYCYVILVASVSIPFNDFIIRKLKNKDKEE